jgi:hypothetical protein
MNMHLVDIPSWIMWTWYGGTVLAAFWGGSWQGRLIATAQFAQGTSHFIICHLVVCVRGHEYVGPWRYVLEDLVLLAIMLVCAATGRRYWVIWAASIQLSGVVTDLLYIAFKPAIGAWTYASASRIWTLLIFSLVLWDVVQETRMRRVTRQAGTASP